MTSGVSASARLYKASAVTNVISMPAREKRLEECSVGLSASGYPSECLQVRIENVVRLTYTKDSKGGAIDGSASVKQNRYEGLRHAIYHEV